MFEMKVVCETSAINEIIEAIKLVFTFENIVNLVSLVILSMKKQKSKVKAKLENVKVNCRVKRLSYGTKLSCE